MTHACYCVTKHSAPLERMECPHARAPGAEVLIRMTAAGCVTATFTFGRASTTWARATR